MMEIERCMVVVALFSFPNLLRACILRVRYRSLLFGKERDEVFFDESSFFFFFFFLFK